MRRHTEKFGLAALMAMEFPPQQFVVKDLLPVGLSMLAGAPKLGKSWASLDLALSVAHGRPFLGRDTDQGSVLYLALEDTPRRLQDRLRLLGVLDATSELPLEFWTEVAAVDEGGLEALRRWLAGAERPRLIIVDVWGRFSPRTPTAKNEYDHITHTLQPLQALAAQYGVAVLLIHHVRKSSGEGTASDPFDQILGSRALTSNMDTTMMLTRTRMQQDAVLNITGRDVEESQLALTFDKATYRWQPTDRPLVPAFTPERQQVLDAVAAGFKSAQTIADHLGKTRTAVQNHLAPLVQEGHLEKVGRGDYRLPGAQQTEQPLPPKPTDVTDIADFDDSEVFTDLI
ncbi:AAA family ATPase [Deinococcus sp. RL]|uniref:AAA family ATPase n=1 Tax=Deinococcus sp. RL TaxID=1489678 RepID=UPI0013770333|nr:AAA family ATPase [Deinococcus sp. RL]